MPRRGGRGNPSDREAQKRLARRRESRRLARARQSAPPSRRVFGGPPSAVLKFYRNEVGPLALRPKPAGVTIKFPKIFSFIEAPDEALDVLEELVAYCHDDRTLSVVIDQSECELIELGAEAVAGVLAKEGKRIGTGFSGYFPEDPEQAAIAYSAGIRRALKPGGDTHKWEGDILCFPLRHGRNDKRWSRICVSAARGH